MDKVIKLQQLPSGATAIATETAPDGLGIEIGSGVIFMTAEDIPAFKELLNDADRHFLGKE